MDLGASRLFALLTDMDLIVEPVPSYIKHPRFHFPDGSLNFIIENTEYFVHRWWIMRHSSQFAWSESPLDSRDDQKEPQAVVLEKVTVREMDALLSLIYPTDIQRRDLSNVEEWIAVLRLSTRWSFDSCRQLALSFLKSRIPAFDKLALAHELEIPEWLEPAYVALCQRKEPLTITEGKRLPLADIFAIFTVREALQREQAPATTEDISQRIRTFLDDAEPASTNTRDNDKEPVTVEQSDVSSGISDIPSDAISSSIPNSIGEDTPDSIQPPHEDGTPLSPAVNSSPADQAETALVVSQAVNGSDHPSSVTPASVSPALPQPMASIAFSPPAPLKPKAVARELDSGSYERAIDGINPSSVSSGQLAPVIAAWANTPVQHRGAGSIRNFMTALFSRAMRDVSFNRAAIKILADLKRDIDPTVRDVEKSKGSSTSRGVNLINSRIFQAAGALLRMADEQGDDSATSQYIWKTDATSHTFAFKGTESMLTVPELALRRRNGDIFIGQLLQAGLLSPDQICDTLTTLWTTTTSRMREILIRLGPYLDTFGGEKELSSALTALKDQEGPVYGGREIAGMIQDIRELRAQSWSEAHRASGTKGCDCAVCARAQSARP